MIVDGSVYEQLK